MYNTTQVYFAEGDHIDEVHRDLKQLIYNHEKQNNINNNILEKKINDNTNNLQNEIDLLLKRIEDYNNLKWYKKPFHNI